MFLLAAATAAAGHGEPTIVWEKIGNSVVVATELDGDAISAIESRMRVWITEDLEIEACSLAVAEVLRNFEERGQGESCSAELVRASSDTHIACHRCAEFLALAYGAAGSLVSRTSELSAFAFTLARCGDGEGLRLSFRIDGTLPVEPVLTTAYAARREWSQRQGFSSVHAVNSLISSGQSKRLIQLSEALHDSQFCSLAAQIVSSGTQRLVLIAGPSSSGKTTFAKRLSVALETLGASPVVISVDSYYKSWAEIDSRGMQYVDWESLQSLNLSLLNVQLLDLLAGKEIRVPEYDMKTSCPMSEDHWVPMKLPPGGVVIMEGIHCLNAALTPRVPRAEKFQICISPLSAVRVDNLHLVSSTHVRMLRRMVRDFLFRGRSALSTLRQWPGVAAGEITNIYPNQNNADATFNSAMPYEVHVLKIYAEPLLRTITPDLQEYEEARRLLAMLSVHAPLPTTLVPPQSLLREFTGGSWFYEYSGQFQMA